jgi:hypothetical protein
MRPLTAFAGLIVLLLTGAAVGPAHAGDDVQLPSGARIGDPRGDAEGQGAAARRRADLTQVRYRMPRREGGLFTVSVQFARLLPRDPDARLDQGFNTQLRSGGVGYEVLASSDRARPRVLLADDDSPIRPERIELVRRPGVDGRLTLRFSTEFLTSRRAHVETFGLSSEDDDVARPDHAWDTTPRGTFERVDRPSTGAQ